MFVHSVHSTCLYMQMYTLVSIKPRLHRVDARTKRGDNIKSGEVTQPHPGVSESEVRDFGISGKVNTWLDCTVSSQTGLAQGKSTGFGKTRSTHGNKIQSWPSLTEVLVSLLLMAICMMEGDLPLLNVYDGG